MSILSSEVLAYARTVLETSLPDTCNILEPTTVSDGQGGYTVSWGTATGGSAIACRLDAQLVKQADSIVGAALQDFFSYTLTLPYSTSITSYNRVEHGGVTYAVASVDADKSWPVSRRCTVERL